MCLVAEEFSDTNQLVILLRHVGYHVGIRLEPGVREPASLPQLLGKTPRLFMTPCLKRQPLSPRVCVRHGVWMRLCVRHGVWIIEAWCLDHTGIWIIHSTCGQGSALGNSFIRCRHSALMVGGRGNPFTRWRNVVPTSCVLFVIVHPSSINPTVI